MAMPFQSRLFSLVLLPIVVILTVSGLGLFAISTISDSTFRLGLLTCRLQSVPKMEAILFQRRSIFLTICLSQDPRERDALARGGLAGTELDMQEEMRMYASYFPASEMSPGDAERMDALSRQWDKYVKATSEVVVRQPKSFDMEAGGSSTPVSQGDAAYDAELSARTAFQEMLRSVHESENSRLKGETNKIHRLGLQSRRGLVLFTIIGCVVSFGVAYFQIKRCHRQLSLTVNGVVENARAIKRVAESAQVLEGRPQETILSSATFLEDMAADMRVMLEGEGRRSTLAGGGDEVKPLAPSDVLPFAKDDP